MEISTLVYWGKSILQVVGGLTLLLTALSLLFSVIPKLASLKATFFKWAADNFKYLRFKRAAIKSEMEEVVNEVVFELQKELPKGWIKRASIKWVRNLERKDKTPEGELILRVRPAHDSGLNLVYAVHAFFTETLFPKVGHVIPDSKKNAVALLVSRKAVSKRNASLRELFDQTVTESAVNSDPNILENLSRYERMDNFGFFTGTFLRESHCVANKSLYIPLRTRLDTELGAIELHIMEFIKSLSSRAGEISEPLWSRRGPVTCYGFLLVARPDNNGTKNYVSRAIEKRKSGVSRLYVLAREAQRHFASQVISEIVNSGSFRLEEKFSLSKDYRCNHGGLGAVLIADEEQSDDLDNTQET